MFNIFQWSWLWSAFLFFGLQAQEYPEYKTESGIRYRVIRPGTGEQPKPYSHVQVDYHGALMDGTKFDSNTDVKVDLNRAIVGWQQGVPLMKVGAQFQFIIPAELAYGEKGREPNVPPNSDLVYDIELLGIEPPKEINRIVAKVDDELITWVDLYTRGVGLDDLIKTKLIFNALNKIDGKIPSEEIDMNVEQHVQKNYGGDRAKFLEDLASTDIPFDRFREKIEERLALEALIDKNYFKDAAKPTNDITSHERQIAQQELIKSYASQQTVSLSIIGIRKDAYASEKGPEESARYAAQEIRRIHAELSKTGVGQFEKLGGKVVKGVNGNRIKPNSLSTEVHRAVSRLKAGEFSEVVDDGLSLKIVLLTDRSIPNSAPTSEMVAKIEQLAIDTKWQKYYDSLLNKLRTEATISIYE